MTSGRPDLRHLVAVNASHFSMNYLRPAVGHGFVAGGSTFAPGASARAELFAEDEAGETSLAATGETLLVPIG